jgi:hypothetical protein
MKLDRNINSNKRGKYALLKLRKLDEFIDPDDPFQQVAPKIADALKVLENAGILDWGLHGTESEFMLIRLKDKYARPSLIAYADAAHVDDPEYAAEISELADRSGQNSPWCKSPD